MKTIPYLLIFFFATTLGGSHASTKNSEKATRIKSVPITDSTIWLNPEIAVNRNDLVFFDKGRLAIADVDAPDPWLHFADLQLPKNAKLSIRFARTSTDPDYIDPMVLEVRTDSLKGPLVGFFDLDDTGSWNEYQSRSIDLKPLQGASSLFFQLHGNGGVNIENLRIDAAKNDISKPLSAAPNLSACINLGGSLEAPSSTVPNYWGLQIEASDLATIAAAGFDSVRLPVRWSDYATSDAPYLIEPQLFKKIDAILGWAFEHKLKVVLDIHHYVELNHQPELHTKRFLALWSQIAKHFKDVPNDQLIFEVLNEPFDGSENRSGMSIARTDLINKNTLEIIRQTNPERWVVLATGAYGGIDGLRMATPPADDKVILSLHYYSPFEFTHQGAEFIEDTPAFGAEWGSFEDQSQIDRDFNTVDYWKKQWDYPMFLGEFGVIYNANTDGVGEAKIVSSAVRAGWIKYVRKAAEDRAYGWCFWDYATTFAAYDKQSGTWDKKILEALID